MIKQPERDFDAQHSPHRIVDHRLGYGARFYQRSKMRSVCIAFHIHVDTGEERFGGCDSVILGYALRNQLANRVPVACHETLESPFFLKDLGKGEGVSGSRHAVQSLESAHKRCSTGLHRGLEWWQIYLSQQAIRNFGGIVIASALCCAITYKVFGTGSNGFWASELFPLIATYVSRCDRRAEVWVFPATLYNPAPTCIARDIHHGRIRPADPGVAGFFCRDASGLLNERRIPGCRKSQRYWKLCAKPMNDVEPKQQRNVKPRLLHGDLLHGISLIGACEIKDRTQSPLSDHLLVACSAGTRSGRRALRIGDELPDFLIECHLFEECVNFGFYLRIIGPGWGSSILGGNNAEKQTRA